MPHETPSCPKQSASSHRAGEPTSIKGTLQVGEIEGGHMSSRFGRIVRDPAAERPYKVILSHDEGPESECAFSTMREAEAFIHRNTPRPRARDTFWDRDALEGQAL
jgi:hypothetical protein